MMYLMIDKAADFAFMCDVGFKGVIILMALCVIVGIIEAIPTKEERAARKRRKNGKRYTVEIRPGRRY